jgi:predicted Zn-dependent protease
LLLDHLGGAGHDTLGWILAGSKETDRALEVLGKAATMAPDQPEIRYHYAVVLNDAARRDESCRELRDLMALGVDFPSIAEARDLLRTLSCG